MVSTFLTVLILFAVIFVLEVALFWASTALGNVEINAVKLLSGALLAAIFWTGALYTIDRTIYSQPDPLEPERRWVLALVILGSLVVSWVVPALLFVPVLPVSVRRGMVISVFQLLLRLFLYTLVGAIIMVILALLQIRYGPTTPQSSTRAPTQVVAPLS